MMQALKITVLSNSFEATAIARIYFSLSFSLYM